VCYEGKCLASFDFLIIVGRKRLMEVEMLKSEVLVWIDDALKLRRRGCGDEYVAMRARDGV
jgi:hypothetical protein